VKSILILFALSALLLANEHYAKIEPLKTVILKAEINGKVVKSVKEKEGEVVEGVIVQVDDTLNRKDLQSTLDSLKVVEKIIDINSKMVADLKKNMQRKLALYEKVAPLSSSSVNQKDALYAAYVTAKTQYNGTLEKILNLKNQKIALEQKINLLKDTIKKKRISIDSKYLYKLNVEAGEFVNVGMPVATVMNLDRGKLILYLTADELKDINKKKVFINGKEESSAKITKVWRVADSQYISSYRVEVELKAPKEFSNLVKVELK